MGMINKILELEKASRNLLKAIELNIDEEHKINQQHIACEIDELEQLLVV